MISGEAAVIRATATVFVAGRQAGSAVLVDGRHLLTARHVMLRRILDGVREPVEEVELAFPAVTGSEDADRVVARAVYLGPESRMVDVAVLDLGESPPNWLPKPVVVWPAARMPPQVRIFGYPLAEGVLNGVWRDFAVSGPTAGRTVQLGWSSDAGSFPGHSGSPVVDTERHTLAGILVEGSKEGRFDRFVPVTIIGGLWTRLPRRWLVRGSGRDDARGHFTRRAHGQRSAARGGDLFRGRDNALLVICEWLAARKPPGQALVITGQPGAGKSAVISRAALVLESRHIAPGLAFHARGATLGDFLLAVADLTGMDEPTSVDQLVTELKDEDNAMPWLVPARIVVDALDEAASAADRNQIAEALAELAVLAAFRVAVSTRTLAVGDSDTYRYAPGGILSTLGVMGSDSPNLVDLDTDTFYGHHDLEAFVQALLTQSGMDHPGPPGGAWQTYRSDHLLCDRLAGMIAQRADRNFLVAAMAAVPLSMSRGCVDPASPAFSPSAIPSGVGEVLGKYLEQLPEPRRDRERGLLSALAYGRGGGLDDALWLSFARALGYPATIADLDTLRRSPAADLLLQVTMQGPRARPLTRLFHQALADELLLHRHRPSDESALLDALYEEAARTEWKSVYIGSHAAEHAALASRFDALLEDPHYLIAADPVRLVAQLSSALSPSACSTAMVYEKASPLLGGDAAARASELELVSHQIGHTGLAARIAAAAPSRPWHTAWSRAGPAPGASAITRYTESVSAVGAAMLADGTSVVVTGGIDGTVRVWRLADGFLLGRSASGHAGWVQTIAVGSLADGTPVVVTGSGREVRVWRLGDGVPTVSMVIKYPASVSSVTTATLADETPVVVSGSGRAVYACRLADGTPLGGPLTGHAATVSAVAASALPDGTRVIVSGSNDYTLEVWDMMRGVPIGNPLTGHTDWVLSVASGTLADGTPIAVSGGNDGTIRMWLLPDGGPIGDPITGHAGAVPTVAVGALTDGTRAIISGGGDKTVRLWELPAGAPLSQGLQFPEPVWRVGLIGGDAVVATTTAVTVSRPYGGRWRTTTD
jgi:V8-like Glu-specific endopeptidase